MKNNAFVRTLCRILIVCFAASSMTAQAGLIRTDQAVAGAAAASGGARVARDAVALQLEALGLASDSARERVAALSDAEALDIAGRLDAIPAGAGPEAIFLVLILVFLIWRFGFSDQAKAEEKAREGAAQKEAPAKK
jgi:uncharacterized protein DUF6627